jgi:hypothetical protein
MNYFITILFHYVTIFASPTHFFLREAINWDVVFVCDGVDSTAHSEDHVNFQNFLF